MQILSTPGWKDYELLDSGNGMRYERFGPYTTVRPDPQAIWQPKQFSQWHNADVQFIRTVNDKGEWKFKRKIPEKWKMTWKNLSFWARLTSFKHTGVFPEQVLQWEWMQWKIEERMKKNEGTKMRGEEQNFRSEESELRSQENFRSDQSAPRILNLFAYTGLASLACLDAGAEVTHVDASKPSVSWARENQILSGFSGKPLRWILDDCLKFIEREVKRGNTYDGIIMDPPVYGHGPTGQIWKFNEQFPKLIELSSQLLSKNPLFVVVNAYAISSSSLMLENVLSDFLPKGLPAARLPDGQGRKRKIEVGELCLQETLGKRLLSTGLYARWST